MVGIDHGGIGVTRYTQHSRECTLSEGDIRRLCHDQYILCLGILSHLHQRVTACEVVDGDLTGIFDFLQRGIHQ